MTDTYNQAGLTYDSAAVTYDGQDAFTSVFPLVGVFVAFTDGPYVTSPNWQEITPYVRSITTSRGRADDLQDFDSGTAQLVLDNRDRRFDPFNTAGPYYLNLIPRRQIKIVAQSGGVNYDVFRGYVAGWPVQWSEAGYDSTVTIQAFDALGLMANEIVPTDWLGQYTTSLNPYRYWRMDDAPGLPTLSEYYGNEPLVNSQPGTLPNFFEGPSIADGILATSAFTTSYFNQVGGANPRGPITGNTDFTVSAWVQFLAPTNWNGIFGTINFQLGGRQMALLYLYRDWTSGGFTYLRDKIYVQSFGFSGANNIYEIAVGSSVAMPFHYVATYTASTNAVRIFINGVDRTSTATGAGVGGLSSNDLVAALCTNVASNDFSVFTRVLSQTEITEMYQYGTAKYSETTAARMTRLRSTTDYPAALTSFTASPVASVSEIGSAAGVIPEMQLTTDSEGGEFYADKSGILTMTSRFDAFNAARSATSQATFTDSGVGLRYGPEVTIEYDADALKNDITVNFTGDGEVSVVSDAVIEAYGGAALTIETYLDSPTAATALGTAKLGVYGALVPRISPIEVSVNTAAADWQTILGLELLDRVTFKRTPATGPQFNREALVNGIDHQIEPGVWRTQLALSMRYTSPLICDDDVLGTVDFNYCG